MFIYVQLMNPLFFRVRRSEIPLNRRLIVALYAFHFSNYKIATGGFFNTQCVYYDVS